ncbi:MAG: antitoxin Xre/MbcA/ParS toxin-binding domain-containing protein [Chitinophagaceae bacterium]
MSTKIKKGTTYAIKEVTLPVMDEAALQYDTLRVILGGNKSVKNGIAGDFDLIALTREGVKKSTLKSLAEYLGISMEKMSSLLHSSHRNIQRKDDDELLDSLKTEKVLELASFVQRGIQVIGNKQAFKEWLHSSLIALGNQTPIDYLDTSFGIQMVIKILGRLEHGVY